RDLVALTNLEVRNGLLGAEGNRLLAGDHRQVTEDLLLGGGVQLGAFKLMAHADVDHDLVDAGQRHRVGDPELFPELFGDRAVVFFFHPRWHSLILLRFDAFAGVSGHFRAFLSSWPNGWPVFTAIRRLEPSAPISNRTRVGFPSDTGETFEIWMGISFS